jgi:hypothetical protein
MSRFWAPCFSPERRKTMKTIRLYRHEMNYDGTFGRLFLDWNYGQLDTEFWTCELPWYYNFRAISCIPAGRYNVKHYSSKRFGETLKVANVPGREGILFHIGNWVDNTDGCILVGKKRGSIYVTGEDGNMVKQPAVLRSKIAFTKMMEIIDSTNDSLQIDIRWAVKKKEPSN